MPKGSHFNFVIQNPPYSGSLHLNFLEKGYDMLADDGQMVIIEPSTWLIELRQNIAEKKSSQMKKYIDIKKKINGQVSKVIIENYNKEFNVGLYVPFSITYINKAKKYNNIEFFNCGMHKYVNSLFDCNLIGNIEIIKSIFNKIKKYDAVTNHLYISNKSEKIEGNYFIPFNGLCAGTPIAIQSIRPNSSSTDARFYQTINENFYKLWFNILFHGSYEISDIVPKSYARGGSTTNNKKFSDKDAECITGTKQELENWKFFVFNNSLPLFINICLTIDQHNNSLPYVPWLVDKQYTDEEIYNLFGFTNEEIKLIETTIKKYERYSPWFKRYMCGKDSVSDEEVQKFIDNLIYEEKF